MHKMDATNRCAWNLLFTSLMTVSLAINIAQSFGPLLPSTIGNQQNMSGGTEVLLGDYSTWIISRPDNSSMNSPFEGGFKRTGANTNTNLVQVHNEKQPGLRKFNKTNEKAGQEKVS